MSVQTQRKIYSKILTEKAIEIELTLNHLVQNSKTQSGIMAFFRYIFPEIESFGGYLLGGGNSSICGLTFIKSYLGRINHLYIKRGAFLWAVYRHSFIHNGDIAKLFAYKGVNIGIGFGAKGEEDHLKLTGETPSFYVCTRKLADDFLQAIKLYICDLTTEDHLVLNFDKSYLERINGTNGAGGNSLDLEVFIRSSKNKVWINEDDIEFIKDIIK